MGGSRAAERLSGGGSGGWTMSILPNDMRQWRACLFCSLLKTAKQFEEEGCDNCPFLDMIGSSGKVAQLTSSRYSGVIGIMEPQQSWLVKYMEYSREIQPGLYALSVTGTISEYVAESLEANN